MNTYKIGQPVIGHGYELEPIIGYIIQDRGEGWYEIEWCDGEVDMYPEHNVTLYVNSYNEISKQSS